MKRIVTSFVLAAALAAPAVALDSQGVLASYYRADKLCQMVRKIELPKFSAQRDLAENPDLYQLVVLCGIFAQNELKGEKQ